MYTENEILRLAREAYRNGRADFAVNPKRCALLVIDMGRIRPSRLDNLLGPGSHPHRTAHRRSGHNGPRA